MTHKVIFALYCIYVRKCYHLRVVEPAQSINTNAGIVLSRNTPVALVVGAGSFLGSHLVDGLINKNIQVIGADDFKDGKRENLEQAARDKNFHSVSNFSSLKEFNLPRLDYLFIVGKGDFELESILKVFRESKCRILFISSIDLYNSKTGKELEWYKTAEIKIAKFANENHLNARILRLGSVFGPRMDFKNPDPIGKLIQASLKEELQKEVNLDFSTRALYIADAIELIIKAMLAGATALKIFDGVNPTPIKVSEVKQVLLDPVWYENKGFSPTELPPWLTPNLEKTIDQLHWRPKTELVSALKHTLNYFKDHEIDEPKEQEEKIEVGEPQQLFQPVLEEATAEKPAIKKPKGEHIRPKIQKIRKYFFLYFSIGIILYALVWPIISLGFEIFTFRYNLNQAAINLEKGEFDKSLANVSAAGGGVAEAENLLSYFEPVGKMALFNGLFGWADNLVNLADLSQTSARSTILGIQALYQGLRAVTGDSGDSPDSFFDQAQVELTQADNGFSNAQAILADKQFQSVVPFISKERMISLGGKLSGYADMVKKARAAASLLPEITAVGGQKNYLILLQNNMELRPGGGFIGSFAQINFEGGKLKKLEVNDIYAIDGQLKIHVEPPAEIKSDLGQKDWFLRDSNFEPDFPTAARQAEWFYTQETGARVEGVVALDVSAIENLLKVVGSLDLADYNEQITSENLFEKAIAHAEQNFFPGSQAKKTFLTALTAQTLNKIFFLPSPNWPGIVDALGESLEGKHLSLYLNDPKLFSFLLAQNWTGALPRSTQVESNKTLDFLAPVEANLGGNKANYYLTRSYKLQTGIGKDGEINQRLKISYINRSPDNTWPGGLYKNRFRVYLPFGSKLNRASWGNKDVTKDTGNFVDYGRSGISLLLELNPKEQKDLLLDYQLPGKLKFVSNVAVYHLDVIKQAGTLKDPFEWTISYPINYRLTSDQDQITSPQEQTITTDLSSDRSFELSFNKSL